MSSQLTKAAADPPHPRPKRDRPINTLLFTTLYPNQVQPVHGVFVEQRLLQLVATGDVVSRVVAPVPWFPAGHRVFGRYGQYARVPRIESRHGLEVHHPRYPVIPKIGMTFAPALLSNAAIRFLKPRPELRESIDLIDAHYLYPDGVAAVHLGRVLGKPVVITGRGTDLNVIPGFRLARRQIAWAARRAAGLVTVSEALKIRLARLGVPDERIVTLRNGVNPECFYPIEHEQARRQLGFATRTILAVGGLTLNKGHHLIVQALAVIPETDLLIVGEGPERRRLVDLVKRMGLENRVRLVGQVSQAELRAYYCAAEISVLASSQEGWANVLLESMACGTPVVATDIEGTREVVTCPAAGLLVRERTPEGLAEGIRALLANPPSRSETRDFAESLGWEPTTRGQIELFERILDGERAGA